MLQTAQQKQQAGNLQQAEDIYNKILKKQPNNAEAYYNLGFIYGMKKQTDKAVTYYQKALQYDPNNSVAYNNLGGILQEKKLLNQAIDCYQKALKLDPGNPIFHYNLGSAWHVQGQYQEATNYYKNALQLNFVDKVRLYNNLGGALYQAGEIDEAIAYYQKAIQLRPSYAQAYYNLGTILKDYGKINDAVVAFNRALALNPNYMEALWSRCFSQLPAIYQDQKSVQIYRNRYSDELFRLRDQIKLNTPQEIEEATRAIGIQQPFFLAYQGLNDRNLQQLYGELVCKIMSLRYPQFSVRPIMPANISGNPLRVGIVSGYFNYHSVWIILIKGWIENLDKNKINLYGYYTGKKKDTETEKARHYCTKFVEDIYSFEEICKTISKDNLHVIIYPEIGMDSVTLKLAALRLAPVQCASWGHPDTSGLPTIDYYLSAELMETPDSDAYYTERLICLPNLSIHYTPKEFQGIEMNREMFNLPPKTILYHCCQALFKFLPQYDEIFPRIAQQVGDCKFLFSSLPRSNFIIEQFRIRIYRIFEQFDMNASDYIIFLPHLDPQKYNALNRICDIFLDPIGWSGCTSTLEALDCNLPVIAFQYFLMRGRESSAILTMMGLQETIAASIDDYVSLAVNLGENAELRSQISARIEKNKHIIYRDKTCITGLEAFLERAVKENLN